MNEIIREIKKLRINIADKLNDLEYENSIVRHNQRTCRSLEYETEAQHLQKIASSNDRHISNYSLIVNDLDDIIKIGS